MAEGWICLHRKMLDNPIIAKDADYIAVWVYLLLNATHQNAPMLFNGAKITLFPGQLITGRKAISEKIHVNEYKVQRILKSFENEQQIAQQTGNKNRLITILNWDLYQNHAQQSVQQLHNNCTTTAQQLHTNNNDNNDNNDNNKREGDKPPSSLQKERRTFKPPTAGEVRAYCQERGNRVDPETFVDFYTGKGWMVGKNKMKDWKAAVRTWERKRETKLDSKPRNRFHNCESHGYDYEDIVSQIGGFNGT